MNVFLFALIVGAGLGCPRSRPETSSSGRTPTPESSARGPARNDDVDMPSPDSANPPVPPGYSVETLVLVAIGPKFWSVRPLTLYITEKNNLTWLQFVGKSGEVYAIKPGGSKWLRGDIKDGIIPKLTSENPRPSNEWLEQFRAGSALVIIDGKKAIPGPPFVTLVGKDKGLPLEPGELERMVQQSLDHLLLVHLRQAGAYSGCEHKSIVAIGEHVVLNLNNAEFDK